MELGIIKTMLTVEQQALHRVARRLQQRGVNIFLPSIFLSFECLGFPILWAANSW